MTRRPKHETKSKALSIRLTPTVHGKLKQLARAYNESINGIVETMIEHYYEHRVNVCEYCGAVTRDDTHSKTCYRKPDGAINLLRTFVDRGRKAQAAVDKIIDEHKTEG